MFLVVYCVWLLLFIIHICLLCLLIRNAYNDYDIFLSGYVSSRENMLLTVSVLDSALNGDYICFFTITQLERNLLIRLKYFLT